MRLPWQYTNNNQHLEAPTRFDGSVVREQKCQLQVATRSRTPSLAEGSISVGYKKGHRSHHWLHHWFHMVSPLSPNEQLNLDDNVGVAFQEKPICFIPHLHNMVS